MLLTAQAAKPRFDTARLHGLGHEFIVPVPSDLYNALRGIEILLEQRGAFDHTDRWPDHEKPFSSVELSEGKGRSSTHLPSGTDRVRRAATGSL